MADPDLSGDLCLSVGAFVLRPLSIGDAPDILTQFSDPRVTQFMDIDPMTTLDEAEAVVRWAWAQRTLGAGIRWAIRDASGALAGSCGFNSLIVERGRRGEIAYDLGHAWWGCGVMSAVMPVLIGFGFERLGLHRLEALVTLGNDRSARLLERHGFTREGMLAGHGFWKGRYWDQWIYGLTRSPATPTLTVDQTAGRSLHA